MMHLKFVFFQSHCDSIVFIKFFQAHATFCIIKENEWRKSDKWEQEQEGGKELLPQKLIS